MKLSRFLRYFAMVQTPEEPTVTFELEGVPVGLESVTYTTEGNKWIVNLKTHKQRSH